MKRMLKRIQNLQLVQNTMAWTVLEALQVAYVSGICVTAVMCAALAACLILDPIQDVGKHLKKLLWHGSGVYEEPPYTNGLTHPTCSSGNILLHIV